MAIHERRRNLLGAERVAGSVDRGCPVGQLGDEEVALA
jgi:hypothetical protein